MVSPLFIRFDFQRRLPLFLCYNPAQKLHSPRPPKMQHRGRRATDQYNRSLKNTTPGVPNVTPCKPKFAVSALSYSRQLISVLHPVGRRSAVAFHRPRAGNNECRRDGFVCHEKMNASMPFAMPVFDWGTHKIMSKTERHVANRRATLYCFKLSSRVDPTRLERDRLLE